MEIRIDFVDYLGVDLASTILTFLNDPADIVRASSVSRSWHRFVIANGICKKLWQRKVSQITHITCMVEDCNGLLRLSDVLSGSPATCETLEMENRIYSALLQPLAMPLVSPTDCIDHEMGNISNALIPVSMLASGASYWSSKGHCDPNVPEYVWYRLRSRICIVTEVDVRPFDVFGKSGRPAGCSAKSVRFRMGHPKFLKDWEIEFGRVPHLSVDEYVWTYSSPEFPMKLEPRWQQFKLPEPVVCIGGVLQVELLSRVKVERCFARVRALGRPLEPAYQLEMLPSGELQLKYFSFAVDAVLRGFCSEESDTVSESEDDVEMMIEEMIPADDLEMMNLGVDTGRDD